jgi:uridine kinase
VSGRLRGELDGRGLRIALINVDGWLNLPETRFSRENPAEHFYRHAIRFDGMFDQLVLSLRDHRSVRVEADLAEETATRYRRHLSPDLTLTAYRIYFPAQAIHFARDEPRAAATAVINNDPRLVTTSSRRA